jgi:hypothetical protein
MRDLLRKAGSLLDLLSQLLKNKHYAVAAELADYTLLLGIRKYLNSDDSSGRFNEFLHQLRDCHLQAYQLSGTSRALTAKQFLKLQEHDDWGFFPLSDYGPLFNSPEYQNYRKVVENEWKKVPVSSSAGKHPAASSYHYYPQIDRMEEVARYEKDIDLLVKIISRSLDSQYQFLRIAEILQQAKRGAEAVSWAERGLASFKKDYDGRLVDYLVAAYRVEPRSFRYDHAAGLL